MKLQKSPLVPKWGDLDSEGNPAGSWPSGEDDSTEGRVSGGRIPQDRARSIRRRHTARKNKDGLG